MSPPVMSTIDPSTGEPRKRQFGPWMLTAMRVLKRFKWLRGTALDPFGRSEERRTERALIGEYEAAVNELLDRLTARNIALAAEIAAIPEFIRGYGPVKARHLKDARSRGMQLMEQWRDPDQAALKQRIPIRAAA